jgi:hypothetical protein
VADKGSDIVLKFSPEGRVSVVFGRKQESSDEKTAPLPHPDPPLPPVHGMFRQEPIWRGTHRHVPKCRSNHSLRMSRPQIMVISPYFIVPTVRTIEGGCWATFDALTE